MVRRGTVPEEPIVGVMNPGLAPAPQLVWFRGSDAVKFLNDLLSKEIGILPTGTVTRSLLLGPQGKLDFILWVLRGEDEVGLITEDGRGDRLVSILSRYRIRVDVEIEPELRDGFLVVGDSEVDPGIWRYDGDGLVADISWPSLPRELHVGATRPDLPDLDASILEAARISDGIALVGVDLDEKTIPQEAGSVSETVSFDKGCFLGQELVARLDSRGGRVNRHLRLLEFDSPVKAGTELHSDERQVGKVTSSAGDIGLALVWREVEQGDRIVAGGIGTTVLEIPHKTAGSFTAS